MSGGMYISYETLGLIALAVVIAFVVVIRSMSREIREIKENLEQSQRAAIQQMSTGRHEKQTLSDVQIYQLPQTSSSQSNNAKHKPKVSVLVIILLIISGAILGKVLSPLTSRVLHEVLPVTTTATPTKTLAPSTPPPTPYTTIRPTSTSAPLKPVTVFNGMMLSTPSYECTCPLTVSVPVGTNFYIYLRYLHQPGRSTEVRQLLPEVSESGNSSKLNDDISFYVKGGNSVSLDVPIGVYKISYACGETWYGTRYRFGEDTMYYTSDDTLTFFADDQYYNGHTLELWLQNDGNFDRTSIPESKFPA